MNIKKEYLKNFIFFSIITLGCAAFAFYMCMFYGSKPNATAWSTYMFGMAAGVMCCMALQSLREYKDAKEDNSNIPNDIFNPNKN